MADPQQLSAHAFLEAFAEHKAQLERARLDVARLQSGRAKDADHIRALEDLLRRARPTLVSAGMHVLAREVLDILPTRVPEDIGPRVAAPSGERTGWDAPPADVVARFGSGGAAYRPSAWVLSAWHACFCIECPVDPVTRHVLPCENERELPIAFYRRSSEGEDAQRMLIGERKYRRKYGMA